MRPHPQWYLPHQLPVHAHITIIYKDTSFLTHARTHARTHAHKAARSSTMVPRRRRREAKKGAHEEALAGGYPKSQPKLEPDVREELLTVVTGLVAGTPDAGGVGACDGNGV